MEPLERLKALAERMKKEVERGAALRSEHVTVRELLSWFGYGRRGSLINDRIRRTLDKLDLRTVPEFDRAWIDETIAISLNPETVEDSPVPDEPPDPTVRVGGMDAANREPTATAPDAPLRAATTLMHMNDFSQLPVMPNSRDVKGVISWRSIGSRLSLGGDADLVRQCMDTTWQEVGIDAPLLDAVGVIRQHGYVLVRGRAREICGIVTWSDIAEQFTQLAGPFMIIGEVEGYLRALVHRRFSAEQIRAALPDPKGGRPVSGPADLTLGGYCMLLGNPDLWDSLRLNLDRGNFVDMLDRVRRMRNGVMHFNPDGLSPEELKELESVARFFRNLRRMGVI